LSDNCSLLETLAVSSAVCEFFLQPNYWRPLAEHWGMAPLTYPTAQELTPVSDKRNIN